MDVLCVDCKYYSWGYGFHHCSRVKTVVDGSSALFADIERRSSKPYSASKEPCGQDGRWFEPKQITVVVEDNPKKKAFTVKRLIGAAMWIIGGIFILPLGIDFNHFVVWGGGCLSLGGAFLVFGK